MRGEHLPVGVPHPGDVAAVGDAVVEDAEDVELAPSSVERAQHLVGAGGVLDQQDRGRAAAEVDRLRAPERGRDRGQAGGDVGQRDVEREAQRGRAERVVDVVEARERELDPVLPVRVRSVNAALRMPRSSTSRATTAGSGRAAPQLGQW